MTDSTPQASKPAYKDRPQSRLYDAIQREDDKAFGEWLKHPDVNVNSERGLALWHAAAKKNYYYMRQLVVAGADIFHARQNAYDRYMIKHEICEATSKKDPAKLQMQEQRDNHKTAWEVLDNYEGIFKNYVAACEAAHAAQKLVDVHEKTLQELLALKQEVLELKQEVQQLREGKPLPKDRFDPSRHFSGGSR